jgi:hypothetical protein
VLLAGLILVACGTPGNVLPSTGSETAGPPIEAPVATPSPEVTPQSPGEAEPMELSKL